MNVTYIELDSKYRDTIYTNPYVFDISTNRGTEIPGQLVGGTPTSRLNTRQYEVKLLEFTIPLANLSWLNQPYLYVKFGNSGGVDMNYFYSNNNKSAGKYFRVSLETDALQTNSAYATFKSNMTHVINLSFQENLTLDVRLSDNTTVTKIEPNNTVYNTTAIVINTTSFTITPATDSSNFTIGSTVVFAAGPTGTYIITSINGGLMSVYPKLNKQHTGTTVTNTSHLIDRVTALFELKQVIKY